MSLCAEYNVWLCWSNVNVYCLFYSPPPAYNTCAPCATSQRHLSPCFTLPRPIPLLVLPDRIQALANINIPSTHINFTRADFILFSHRPSLYGKEIFLNSCITGEKDWQCKMKRRKFSSIIKRPWREALVRTLNPAIKHSFKVTASVAGRWAFPCCIVHHRIYIYFSLLFLLWVTYL